MRIALEGEVDLANGETAASILREALLCGKNVVVDLTNRAFLASTGVSMLVTALRDGGQRLSFLPSEHEAVSRLLSLTGLEERMNFVSTGAIRLSAEEAEPLQPAA